jgi:hypothetical protein
MVASLHRQVGDIALVFAGDITNSGAPEEYQRAAMFVDALRARIALRSTEHQSIAVLAVPGNQDGDMSRHDQVRGLLLEKSELDISETSVLPAITKVQDNFFSFLDSVEFPKRIPVRDTPDRLAYRYQLDAVEFLCINSCARSSSMDKPGTLSVSLPSELPQTDRLRVSVMHHHYSWLQTDNSKKTEQLLQCQSAVVLMGAEQQAVHRSGPNRANHTVFEGPGLTDPQSTGRSAFNIFEVEGKRLRRHIANWTEGRYDPVRETSESEGWTPTDRDESTSGVRFRARQTFLDALDDPGTPLTHRHVEHVALSDIFVPPDLAEINLVALGNRTQPVLLGPRVKARLAEVRGCVITGESSSGKSALARMLCRWLLDDGYMPVLLRGDQLSGRPPDDKSLWLRAASQAYELPPGWQDQADVRSKVAIVVDDFKFGRVVNGAEILMAFTPKVYLFSGSIDTPIAETMRPSTAVDLCRYRIMPFGHLSRNRLVEKWVRLGHQSDEECNLIRSVDHAVRVIDSTLGRNVVPPYPVYILSILQCVEANVAVDGRVSTYGAFYEVFIKQSLQRTLQGADYDVVFSLLTQIAYTLFYRKTRSLSLEELNEECRLFSQSRMLQTDGNSLRKRLIASGLVWNNGNGSEAYGFRYPFQYYYFLACHLRDRLDQEDAQHTVSLLIDRLHIESNSNTILFLVHVCSSRVVMNLLLASAKQQFSSHVECTLSSGFLAELTDRTLIQQLRTFTDVDVRESRRKLLEAQDSDAEPYDFAGGAEEEQDDALPDDVLGRLVQAVKTVGVLGQIARSYPGRLEAGEKKAIVEQCVGVSLRILQWFGETALRDTQQVVREVVHVLRMRHSRWDESRLAAAARTAISWLVVEATFGLVKRTSTAIGHPELRRIYESVLSPSIQSHALINASVHLDVLDAAPRNVLKETAKITEKSILGTLVLRLLTSDHLLRNPLHFSTRQQLCQAVGMEFRDSNQQLNHRYQSSPKQRRSRKR